MKKIVTFLVCLTCWFPILTFSQSYLKGKTARRNFCLETLDRRNFTTFLDLNNCQLNDDDLPAIFAYIADKTWMVGLSLGNNLLTDRSVFEILRHKKLEALVLSNNPITKKSIRAIANSSHVTILGVNRLGLDDEDAIALASNLNLQELYVGGNNITAKGALALAASANLTSLAINGNPIGHAAVQKLAAHPQLTSTDLADTQLTDEDAILLAKNPRLQSLNLNSNHLSPSVALAFAKNSNLQTLYLYDNNLGDEGAALLASNKTLDTLELGKKHISLKGAKALATNTHLGRINLASNAIGDRGAVLIASEASGLYCLELTNTGITTDGAIALAKIAYPNSIYLILRNNPIGNAAVPSLINGFFDKRNNSLDISYTNITDDGLKFLRTATDLGYGSLRIRGNHLSPEGAQALLKFFDKFNEGTLDISDNDLGDKGAKAFSKLRMFRLTINNNHLTQLGIDTLLANDHLWQIYANIDEEIDRRSFDSFPSKITTERFRNLQGSIS